MRTKLALLLALCRGAELLILDEPTSGLDPVATEEVLKALVAHVASEGITVVFSTNQIAAGNQSTAIVVFILLGPAARTRQMTQHVHPAHRKPLSVDVYTPT